MNPQRMARFVRKWFAEWEAKPARYGRASRILTHLIEERPDEAWVRILALVAGAKTESLGYVGAGPLEDLLSEHGPTMLDRVETTAGINARFAACLACVWGNIRFEPSVYATVQRIIHASKA
jgi:hypothetical protein